MKLESGAALGAYEILAPIGAGAMGEVYRARDTRLGREVAVKLLPEAFAQDPERLGRFQREARLLASLNHPSIATLYGLEESDGMHFLVMELVEGQSLAERISRRPIPVDEALVLFQAIAEGLEAAHDKTVIHRDLKPDNIRLTAGGRPKILDFGLAIAYRSEEASDPDLSKTPTLSRKTAPGVILGTAPYMSPEQVRGHSLGKSADIWAFGCCLYETLAGKAPFRGETVSDVLAGILEREPDWTLLPNGLPRQVERLLRRCLRKDPRRRFRDAWDVRIEMDEALKEPEERAKKGRALPRGVRPAWFLLGALVAALLAGLGLRIRGTSLEPPVARLVVNLPRGQELLESSSIPMDISSDGSQLVYAAFHEGRSRLYLRRLDAFEARPLPGTEGAEGPFFSPDGAWVGFFANEKLQKVSVAGGTPLQICDAPRSTTGASWSPDGTIVFGTIQTTRSLYRVSANGGEVETLTTPASPREFGHGWPELLPDGRHVLFVIGATRPEEQSIAVLDLHTGAIRKVLGVSTLASRPRYLSTRHLVYAEGGSLWAARFDLDRLEIHGSPVPLLDGVRSSLIGHGLSMAHFAISATGSLVYAPGPVDDFESNLVWVDRLGNITPISGVRDAYWRPRLSPDGTRIAMEIRGRDGIPDIWIQDLERGGRMRLTTEGQNISPVWSPNGDRIVFGSDREGRLALYWASTDGSGGVEKIFGNDDQLGPSSWSRARDVLAFWALDSANARDIWVLPIEEDGPVRSPAPILSTPFNERSPVFSPDGRWLAYVSDESGRDEVYVREFPDEGRKWLVSTAGGNEPLWSPDGRELFYRWRDRMFTVAVTTTPSFSAGSPELLFEGKYGDPLGIVASYDVAPDGKKFLMVRASDAASTASLHVVLHWSEELKQLRESVR